MNSGCAHRSRKLTLSVGALLVTGCIELGWMTRAELDQMPQAAIHESAEALLDSRANRKGEEGYRVDYECHDRSFGDRTRGTIRWLPPGYLRIDSEDIQGGPCHTEWWNSTGFISLNHKERSGLIMERSDVTPNAVPTMSLSSGFLAFALPHATADIRRFHRIHQAERGPETWRLDVAPLHGETPDFVVFLDPPSGRTRMVDDRVLTTWSFRDGSWTAKVTAADFDINVADLRARGFRIKSTREPVKATGKRPEIKGAGSGLRR